MSGLAKLLIYASNSDLDGKFDHLKVQHITISQTHLAKSSY